MLPFADMLWRPPEQLRARLRQEYLPPSQKDDVYSFAIILHEIMTREGVWGSPDMEAKQIVSKVNDNLIMNHDSIENSSNIELRVACHLSLWNN